MELSLKELLRKLKKLMEVLWISINRKIGGSRSLFNRMIRVIVIVRMIVSRVESMTKRKLSKRDKKNHRKKDLWKRKKFKLQLLKNRRLSLNLNHRVTENKTWFAK